MIFPESVRERAAAALRGGGVGSSLLGWGRPSPARGRRCRGGGGAVTARGSPRGARGAAHGELGVPARGLRRPSLGLSGSSRGLVPRGERAALPHLRPGLPRAKTDIAAAPHLCAVPSAGQVPPLKGLVFVARQLRVVASYLLSL